jgi:RNA polymerase sigma-70 factor (ECF subfamily)
VAANSSRLLSLLEAHGAELHALFTRLTLRAGAAEDLLQDLFLKLQDADGLVRAADPKAYLFRAAVNLAFDWRRAQRRTAPLRNEPAGVGLPPLDRLISVEELEQVLDALLQLSELGRQVLVLRYLQGQEYGDIAAHLGKTAHQVRALCSKALEQLRLIIRLPAQEPTQRGINP